LRERPALSPSTKALHRLLNQYGNGLLSAETWKGLNMLKSNGDEHLSDLKSDVSRVIGVASADAKAQTGTQLELEHVIVLHCRVCHTYRLNVLV
jgi:hypothetical protein